MTIYNWYVIQYWSLTPIGRKLVFVGLTFWSLIVLTVFSKTSLALSLLVRLTKMTPQRMAAMPIGPAYFTEFFIMIVHRFGQNSIIARDINTYNFDCKEVSTQVDYWNIVGSQLTRIMEPDKFLGQNPVGERIKCLATAPLSIYVWFWRTCRFT